MASKFFERRSVRTQLKTYLETHGWVDLSWAEGFSDSTLETVLPPFIVISIDDFGREELQMGRNPETDKLLNRRIQVDVYMESEDRTNAITDDISDFLDIEAIIIKDNNNTVLGSLISDTSSILTDVLAPDFNDPNNIEWHGVVSSMYEAHYPNG
jgi:hypothetical protein